MKTSYLTASDIDLVTAAQDGDMLAATVLYRRYLPLIHATARTFFTRDRDELLAVIRFAFGKPSAATIKVAACRWRDI